MGATLVIASTSSLPLSLTYFPAFPIFPRVSSSHSLCVCHCNVGAAAAAAAVAEGGNALGNATGGEMGEERERDSPRQTFPPNDPPHGTGEAYASVRVCVPPYISLPNRPLSLSLPLSSTDPLAGTGLGHQFSRRFSFPLFRIPIYFPPNELRRRAGSPPPWRKSGGGG